MKPGSYIRTAQSLKKNNCQDNSFRMKVLIVDDEPLARDRLRYLLGRIDGYVALEHDAGNGRETLELCYRLEPDIVLMDIRMPGMGGLETASYISRMANPPAIIFCTAFDNHALEAFQASAVGYLLKPIRRDDLQAALNQAQKVNRLQLANLDKNLVQADSPGHITAKTMRGIELVPIHDILYFMADSKYVTVHHKNGEVLIDEPLKQLEEDHNNLFVRIHRNALVCRNAIESLSRNEKGHSFIRLKGVEKPLSVSRRHVPLIKKIMQSM